MSGPTDEAQDDAARLARLRALEDLDASRAVRVVVDAAHGAASVLPDVLAGTPVDVVVLRAAPASGAASPAVDAAPAVSSDVLATVGAAVREHGADVGLALDAGGRTLLVVDEEGAPVPTGAVDAVVAVRAVQRARARLGDARADVVVATTPLASRAVADLVRAMGATVAPNRPSGPTGSTRPADVAALHVLGDGAYGAGPSDAATASLGGPEAGGSEPGGLDAALHLVAAVAAQALPVSLLAEVHQPYASCAVDVPDATADGRDRVADAYRAWGGAGTVVVDVDARTGDLVADHWDELPSWWFALRRGPRGLRLLAEAADEDIMEKVRDDVLALLHDDA